MVPAKPVNNQVAFIGEVEMTEQKSWIESINEHSKSFNLLPLASIPAATVDQVEVAVVANPDPDTLNALPNLKWIQSLWAGVEGILGSSLRHDISIVRMTDPQMAESMAEAVLAWSLYLHRKMPQYKSLQSEKQWQPLSLKMPQECNISVFGLGRLGIEAALRLQRNGFTVRGWSSSKKSITDIETFNGDSGLSTILSKTDIAVLLLPLTSQTTALFNKEQLSRLPVGASIINFARGPVIVEADLIECLNNNHLEHAVLDVFDEEPLPVDHALWSNPRVTVLPHISAPTTVATAAEIAAQNLNHYFSSGKIPESVDRNRGY